MTDPLTNIENTLTAHGKTVHRRGNTLQAQCPAHPDRNPSLTINPGTTQPLILHCHAGCTTTAILTALNLTWNDISNPPQPATNNTPPATYTYTDANWTPLYRIIRGPNKQFRQQHLTPNGEWANGRNNITPILYNLPTILAAINEQQTIHIVEGEKDADTLTAHGEIATTNPGGAGNFTPLMADTLQGATHITIIADNDPAGHQHAEHISRLLTERNITHNITLPTHGKDISEQIGQGHPPLQLQPYTPHTTPHDDGYRNPLHETLIDFTTLNERPEPIIDGLIYPGRWTFFYASKKAGKSTLSVALSLDTAKGHDPITGQPTKPRKVLYLDAEMGRLDLAERLDDFGQPPETIHTDLPNWYATDNIQPLNNEQHANTLIAFIDELGIELVVLDGINGFIEGDENNNIEWVNLFRHLIQPLKQRNIAIISNDNSGKDPTKGPRGGSAKGDKADAIMRVIRREGIGYTIERTHTRTSAYTPKTEIVIDNLNNDSNEPMRLHTTTQQQWPRGTADLAAAIDTLNIPHDYGVRKTAQLLRDNGHPARQNVVAAAIKYRNQRHNPFTTDP